MSRPPRPAPPPPPRGRPPVEQVYDQTVAAAVGPLALVLACVHAALIPLHFLALSPAVRAPIVAATALTALCSAGVAALGRWRPAALLRAPDRWLSALGGVTLFGAAVHVLTTGQLWQITNLQLILLGAGGLALRWPAFAFVSGGAWLAVGLSVALFPEDPLAAHFCIGTAMAQAAATLLVYHRRTVIARMAVAEDAALQGQRQAEALSAALSRQQAELQRTVTERDALFAAMNHELRSPIQAVLGVAAVLGGEGEAVPEADRRRAVNTLRASGDMMLHVVNQVLDHSRIERGELAPHRQPLSLPELLDEVFLVLAERAAAQGDRLSWAPLGEPAPVVYADRGWLRQVLLNVVGNAVKFTEGGLVRVSLDHRPSVDEDGSLDVIFVVTDTGPGFAPDAAERIFAPYQQAGPEVAARFGGTGLGLAISRQLARLMGGDIVASAVLGEGARFEISLRATVAGPAARPLAGQPLSVVGACPLAGDLRRRLAALGAAVVAPTRCVDHLLLRPGGPGRPPSLLLLGGRGARRIELPVEDSALGRIASPTGAPSSAAAPRSPALELLLVDDNEVCLTMSHVGLSAMGHGVRVATDSASALRIIDACAADGRPIDAMVFDLHLGAESGVELARAARARAWGPPLLLALTGDPGARGALAGLAAVLLKPALPAEIHAQLEILAQQRPTTSLRGLVAAPAQPSTGPRAVGRSDAASAQTLRGEMGAWSSSSTAASVASR